MHFFDHDDRYERGIGWYLAHFPLRDEAAVTGEASPQYLFHPGVPQRVRATLPDARFIALLRNPVDRAYSSYRLMVHRRHEPLSFEDALASERERLSRLDRGRRGPRRRSYAKRGLYLEQLERWLAVFPRERFLILKSEDLNDDPERIVHQTLAFLGLPPWTPSDFTAHNSGRYPPMDPATRKRLAEYFAPHNRRLYAFLGRDLGWEDE